MTFRILDLFLGGIVLNYYFLKYLLIEVKYRLDHGSWPAPIRSWHLELIGGVSAILRPKSLGNCRLDYSF